MTRARFQRMKGIVRIVLALAVMLLGSVPQPVQADPQPNGISPPAGLSAADWAAILNHLHQTEARLTTASLVTSQVAQLIASDTVADDQFGWSVAVSGDTVVVGIPRDDDWGNDSGSAYVFERNQGGTADNWGQVAKLTADDAAAQDYFGYGVGLSGNTVVVGAYFDDDGANAAGSAYVYRWIAAHTYLPLVLKN